MEQVSGASDNKHLRCCLGDCAENKAKQKEKWVCTNKWDDRLLKDIGASAVVFVLADAVTSKPGYLYQAQEI